MKKRLLAAVIAVFALLLLLRPEAAEEAVVLPPGKRLLPLPKRTVRIKRPLQEYPFYCINGTMTAMSGGCLLPRGQPIIRESCRLR